MSVNTHPLTISNFFTNHIINPKDKELSERDRKIAMIATVILGVCTLGLIHGVVCLARAFLCGRVKKDSTPKTNHQPEQKDDTSTNDESDAEIDPLSTATIRLRKSRSRITSTEITQRTLIRNLRENRNNASEIDIQVADITPESFQALKEASSITAVKLFFADNVVDLPDYFDMNELDHIEKLEVHLDRLEPQLAGKIASMKGLKHLTLDLLEQGRNSSASFRTLRRLQNLESLTVGIMQHFFGIDERGNKVGINAMIFNHALGISGLKKLVIHRVNYLSDSFLRTLSSARSLEELDIHCCTDADVAAIHRFALAALNSLRTVRLGLKQVDQEVYDAVNNLKTRETNPVDIAVSHTFSVRPERGNGRGRSFSD